MLSDSHCHLDCLDLTPYGGDVRKAIDAAREKDVKYILCPGLDIERFPGVLKIVETDANLFAAVALHPTEKDSHEPTLDELLTLGQNKKVVSIGETGLDFYYVKDIPEQERQINLFKTHIQAAKFLNKPLIVHSRDAESDTIKLLINEEAMRVGCVIHCFTGSQAFAEKIIELGFYISFSGIITFKGAHNLREIAKSIPLDKILIETDAPYLAPVPVRGRPNESIYLHHIAELIANLRGMSYDLFTTQTTSNFLRFCKL